MTIFETHAHYDDERFAEDRASLLASMEEHNIAPLINVGATMESAKEGYALAHEYPFVYAAIGVHPSDIDTLSEEGLTWMREHAADPKVAAIGEIGLDYYWEKDEEVRAEQRDWFRRQLALAREVGLPVIIHSREACDDTLSILKEAIEQGTQGVMHCYSYSPEIAQEYVKRGFYLGIGGVVTFKNAKKLKETVQQVPLSRIVVETDSPYLTPEPFRGMRNDSTYLPYIVQAIAKLREITEDEVIETTAENARRLFAKARYRSN